jgi:hypothetical protein
MSRHRGPWDDGHRAWQRLTTWHRDTASAAGRARPETGDAALDAMADIGTIRRLLDQAELVAVRTARRHRKSWAEIATQLGITRQSAWERWRDLDDEPSATSEHGTFESVAESAVAEMSAELTSELTTPAAAEGRRTAKVVVPAVVGMSWDDARHALANRRLLAVSHDPDGPSLAALGWPNVLVVDQIPEAGAKVPVGTRVRLWLERGGGSAGVREPRRPSPAPKSGYEWRPEPSQESSDEAVG